MEQSYNLKEHFHGINLKRKNYLNELIEKTDLNMMQLEIMVSLYESPETNTFTKIMKAKDYAKSFVSTAINDLVKRGYVNKLPLQDNKKVYTLALTDKCDDIIKAYYECIDRFKADAYKGISDKEFCVFQEVLNKILENLNEKQE